MRLLRAFLDGYSSIFDLFGTRTVLRHRSRHGLADDAEAIAGDWQRVGDGLRRAMERVAREHKDGHHA